MNDHKCDFCDGLGVPYSFSECCGDYQIRHFCCNVCWADGKLQNCHYQKYHASVDLKYDD